MASSFKGDRETILKLCNGTKFTVIPADKRGSKVSKDEIWKSFRTAIKSIPVNSEGKIPNPFDYEIYKKDDFRKSFGLVSPQVVFEMMQEMDLLTDEFISDWESFTGSF